MNPSPVRMYCSRMALYVRRRTAVRDNEKPGESERMNGGEPNWFLRHAPLLSRSIVYSPIFFLTGRIQNVNQRDLIINDRLFPVRIYTIRSQTKGRETPSEGTRE